MIPPTCRKYCLSLTWRKQLPYICAAESQYCLQCLRSSFSLIPTLPLFSSSPRLFLFSSLFVISARVLDISVVFWARKKVMSLILTGHTGKFHCSRWAGNAKVRFRGTNKMAWLNSEPSTAEKWDVHIHTLHIFVFRKCHLYISSQIKEGVLAKGVIKTCFGTRVLGFESWHHHSLTCDLASYLTSLSLSSLIYKMGWL